MDIKNFLEDLEQRIDLKEELRIQSCWRQFCISGAPDSAPYFTCLRNAVPASKLPWPEISVNQAIEAPGFELMLLQQLHAVEKLITGTTGFIPMIRPNYGSVILPVWLGCPLHLMDEKFNTLPGAYPLPGGMADIKPLLEKGVPELSGGYFGKVQDCLAFFQETLNQYPKLKQTVKIYHPDYQGPLDIAEVLCGSEIFMAFYDDPELIAGLLDFIVQAYIAAMDHFHALVDCEREWGYHYGWLHRGGIRLSLDSCVNFSADMYREYILPRDRALIERYGGVIHSCGHVDHFASVLPELGQKYHGFNLSQPHLNDMERIYQATVDQGIRIFSLGQDVVQSALQRGRDLHGLIAVF